MYENKQAVIAEILRDDKWALKIEETFRTTTYKHSQSMPNGDE